jgi:acyl-CoA synthetase (AMP-forming)/AMP-acid ligase II
MPGVAINALEIGQCLGITPEDTGLTILPLHYTYGLSVLHSHLVAGGSTLCSAVSPAERGFRSLIERNNVSSLPGVPFSYSLYEKIGIVREPPRSLRSFTQAGGALSPVTVQSLAKTLHLSGRLLYIMYGQTEATARMSVLPPELVHEFPHSAGYSMPSGEFTIGSPVDQDEVVYSGPNVMLGYAHNLHDLGEKDQMNGVLPTGDLGYLRDGLLFLTGRLKRITKVFGERVNLDEVENQLSSHASVAVIGKSDTIVVLVEGGLANLELMKNELVTLGLQLRSVVFQEVREIPRLPSGKPNYAEM